MKHGHVFVSKQKPEQKGDEDHGSHTKSDDPDFVAEGKASKKSSPKRKKEKVNSPNYFPTLLHNFFFLRNVSEDLGRRGVWGQWGIFHGRLGCIFFQEKIQKNGGEEFFDPRIRFW